MDTKDIFAQLLRYFPEGENAKIYKNVSDYSLACLAAGDFAEAEKYADITISRDNNKSRIYSARKIKLYAKLGCRNDEQFTHAEGFSKAMPEYEDWISDCSDDSAKVAKIVNLVKRNQDTVAEEKERRQREEYAKSQYSLGERYYNGQGAERSYSEAAKCFRVAALSGHREAQYMLGECYYSGQGVGQSYAEAANWYRKAAEQGVAEAQNKLGECYYNGRGVTPSYTEAVKWYRKAAEQGVAEAQYSLAVCYYNGQGVEQSYAEAVNWYRKASEQNFVSAQNNLGYCYLNGIGVEQSYAEAAKWYRKAAEQGNLNAQHTLAWCYEKGNGVTQSYAEAVKWYRKAAGRGDAAAQNNLAVCYAEGKGVAQSYTEAANWYRKAAEQGLAMAQYSLAWCYENGRGVCQSYNEAAKWYQKAADQGYANAQNALNRCLKGNNGAAVNVKKTKNKRTSSLHVFFFIILPIVLIIIGFVLWGSDTSFPSFPCFLVAATLSVIMIALEKKYNDGGGQEKEFHGLSVKGWIAFALVLLSGIAFTVSYIISIIYSVL